jgi:hypothetical protein
LSVHAQLEEWYGGSMHEKERWDDTLGWIAQMISP